MFSGLRSYGSAISGARGRGCHGLPINVNLCNLRCLAVGELHSELRSFAHLACDQCFSSVRTRKMFDDGQPESGAARISRTALVDAIEAFKDSAQVIRRNAMSAILHLEDSRS